MITEKKLREQIRNTLLEFAEKSYEVLSEQPVEDKPMDPDDVPGMPKVLQKVLDPDNSPQKFMKLDAMLDQGGTIAQQGGALAGFAINYSDLPLDNPNAEDFDKKAQETLQMLDKAKVALKQMIEKAKQTAAKQGEASDA